MGEPVPERRSFSLLQKLWTKGRDTALATGTTFQQEAGKTEIPINEMKTNDSSKEGFCHPDLH